MAVLAGATLWQVRDSRRLDEVARQAARPAPFERLPPAPAELRALETADPARELRKALRRKDKRFLQAGIMRDFGISGGITNPVVEVAGRRFVEGTTDFIQYADQGRLDGVIHFWSGKRRRLP
jgi:hypothetical protein